MSRQQKGTSPTQRAHLARQQAREIQESAKVVDKPTQPEVRLEEVTPERALEMLGQNVHNRNIRDRRVKSLAEAIRRGEWVVNGEMIRFDTKGHLIDGQHRLLAVLEADKKIQTYVGYGFPPSAQETIDAGAARTLTDALKLRGEKQYAILGAAARKLWAYEQYGVPYLLSQFRSPSIQEAIDTIERHPGLRESVLAFGAGKSRTGQKSDNFGRAMKLLDASGCAVLHYLMSLADEEDANKFWIGVGSGLAMAPGDPRYVLRERLQRENELHGNGVHPRIRMVFAIRAWNYWRNGEAIAKLVFRPGGARPDRFPELDGCPIHAKLVVIGSEILTREEAQHRTPDE